MAELTITAANVIAGNKAKTREGTAGATITAGQVVYKDTTDANKLKPADNTALLTAKVAGIALHGASDGQPLEYIYFGPNFVPGATVAIGEIYVLGASGAIEVAADSLTGEFVSVLGVGFSASVIQLDIRETLQGQAAHA